VHAERRVASAAGLKKPLLLGFIGFCVFRLNPGVFEKA